MGDVAATWSAINTSGASATAVDGTGTSDIFDAGSTAGGAYWTAVFGTIADTVTFTIIDNLSPGASNTQVNGTATFEQGIGKIWVRITADVTDLALGDSNIAAAEFFVSTSGAVYGTNGTGWAMNATDGALNSVTETFHANFYTTGLAVNTTLTICVHGLDAAGNWGWPTGGYACAVVKIYDDTPPPPPDVTIDAVDGLVDGELPADVETITITITISDVGTGDQNLAGAELFIDGIGADGTGYTMVPVDGVWDSPTEQVTITIDKPADWEDGKEYKVYVHGQDEDGNWGETADIPIALKKVATPEDSFPWWILIVIGAVIVFIIVLAMRRGGDEEEVQQGDVGVEDVDGDMGDDAIAMGAAGGVSVGEVASGETTECPTCGETIIMGSAQCPTCGEEFDWEEEPPEDEPPVDTPDESTDSWDETPAETPEEATPEEEPVAPEESPSPEETPEQPTESSEEPLDEVQEPPKEDWE